MTNNLEAISPNQNMLSHQLLKNCLAIICCAGIVFSITGRLAVQQITHDNMAAVKMLADKSYTNSLPESRPDIEKLEVKLYKRIALSQVRESWETICSFGLWCGIIAGIAMVIISIKGHGKI